MCLAAFSSQNGSVQPTGYPKNGPTNVPTHATRRRQFTPEDSERNRPPVLRSPTTNSMGRFCSLSNTYAENMRVWKAIPTLIVIQNPRGLFRCLKLTFEKTISETAEIFDSQFAAAPAANTSPATSANIAALLVDTPIPFFLILSDRVSQIKASDAPDHCLPMRSLPFMHPSRSACLIAGW